MFFSVYYYTIDIKGCLIRQIISSSRTRTPSSVRFYSNFLVCKFIVVINCISNEGRIKPQALISSGINSVEFVHSHTYYAVFPEYQTQVFFIGFPCAGSFLRLLCDSSLPLAVERFPNDFHVEYNRAPYHGYPQLIFRQELQALRRC